MIYLDLPRRDLLGVLAQVEGLAQLAPIDTLPLLGTAHAAAQALPTDDARCQRLPRGAAPDQRAAWTGAVGAILGSAPLAIAAGLGYGFRTWVRATGDGLGWLDALFAQRAPIVMLARLDGTAAVRLRRQAFTDGTDERWAWGYPDVVAHAAAWHEVAAARVRAAIAAHWDEGEAALREAATRVALRWARVEPGASSVALPTPAAVHQRTSGTARPRRALSARDPPRATTGPSTIADARPGCASSSRASVRASATGSPSTRRRPAGSRSNRSTTPARGCPRSTARRCPPGRGSPVAGPTRCRTS
ncbi:MAG: hypothetical protein K8W52_14880 [Deltaproteobacteria bacterium]|nr:hypothetical protein [Deltaproteobacteria bacterium]